MAQILPLPGNVATQIKSSTDILSLCSAVSGLVENALDAGATKIDVNIDFRRGACTVEDDGKGIAPEDFREDGGLGKQYHSSKSGDTNRVHGAKGLFLWSLAALSTLTITSHHHAHRIYATLILHHFRVVARFIPAPSHHHLLSREHGTKVNVQNLFGNMPVRVKHRIIIFDDAREEDKHWSLLIRCIVGLLLAWDVPVKLSLRNSTTNKHIYLRGTVPVGGVKSQDTLDNKFFDMPSICSILSQAGYIEYRNKETWIKTSARTSRVTIQGALSLQPAPSKNAQFISLGVQHISPEVEGNLLYDEVNRIFAASRFGQQEDIFDVGDSVEERRRKDRRFKHDRPTQRQLKGFGKGVDRWPMFVIRIKLHNDDGHATHHGFERLETENTLTTVIEILGTMVTSFLEEHHFRPRLRGHRKWQRSNGEACSVKSPLEQTSPTLPSNTPLTASKQKIGSATKSNCKDTYFTARNGGFNADVIFPKISQNQMMRHDGAFNGWRRIKTGNRGAAHEDLYRNPDERESCPGLEQHSQGRRKRISTSDNAGSHTYTQKESASAQGRDMISADFEILADALERNSDDSEDRSELQNLKETHEAVCNSDGDDEMVQWINPTSKTTFLISSRTGHVKLDPNSRPSIVNDACMPDSLSVRNTGSRTGRKPYISAARKTPDPEARSWVRNLLKQWENPVFRRQEESIAQISVDGLAGENSALLYGRQHRCFDYDISKAFTDVSSSFATRLSKTGLMSAEIISQVDKKFILVKIVEDLVSTTEVAPYRNELLVLIDQHAADERIRIEDLLSNLCSKSIAIPPLQSALGHASAITTTALTKAMSYQIQPREISLFEKRASYFAYWGILYNIDLSSSTITITTLPPLIAERCRSDPKLLIEFLRGEIWKHADLGLTFHPSTSADTPNDEDWRTRIGHCPRGLLDMLNSRACRSAIMFNDELAVEECRELVKRLAKCSFPFKCAHGRPSMIPLVDLGGLSMGYQ